VTTDELPRTRHALSYAATVVVALVVIATACCYATGYLPIRRFDAAGWRAVQRSDDATRLRMVDWLLWTGRLDGLDRAQVVTLLGAPDGGDYFADRNSLVYWLGPERGFLGIDSEWLVIRLGPDGRVSRYELARD
jgi:hypothetical protein